MSEVLIAAHIVFLCRVYMDFCFVNFVGLFGQWNMMQPDYETTHRGCNISMLNGIEVWNKA